MMRIGTLGGVSLLAIMASATAASAQSNAAATISAPAPVATATTATDKPLRPMYRNVRAFYRNVRAFWGDVNPFYRNVRAFWGDVDPFYRNVRAFWGNMDPVVMAGRVKAPGYGGVGPFWENVGGQWEAIAASWQTAGPYDRKNARTYKVIANQLQNMLVSARDFWAPAVARQSGANFQTSFSAPLLARYGIDLQDPSSLAKLDAPTQSEFFFDFYDSLMGYSGTDHADWWMPAIGWTPKLTQTMGSGAGSTLGLVDDYAAKTVDVVGKVKDLSGKTSSFGGHGEGVLSLIVASHDGKDIMGIAPAAKVVGYNPFDNGSADWAGVSTAIQAVAAKGATVINLSLGEPGKTLSPEWQKIFVKSEINTHKDKTLYIIAAGNDGITQSGIVDMKGALDTTFIVVGSVGPTGISEFSNRPGTTCLTDGGTECKYSTSLKESGLLMNRFIVAPGEFLLVSDGAGGVVRQSGTSLAAPLVAGAVALVQDRWPWMREKPRDIAMVILGSATDLGAPGVDPVYGVGMLNVEAAMSPLDFSKLKYYLTSNNGKTQNEIPVSTLKSQGIQPSWVTNDMYFTAFEKLDQVERDFLIPLSARLHGTTRGGEYFQDFVYNRMVKWIAGTSFASRSPGFADGTRTPAVDLGGWKMQMSGRVVMPFDGEGRAFRPQLRSTMHMTSASGRVALAMGHGDGAVALGGGGGLSLAADFDPYAGGANPLLGFATGGTHAATQVALTPALHLRAGFTERDRDPAEAHTLRAAVRDGAIAGLPGRYRASAMAIELGYDAASWLRLTASTTSLREPNGVLGVQPQVGSDLAGGSRAQGMTIGADVTLGAGLSLFGAATTLRARSPERDASLRLGDGGVRGSAFQVGLAKQGLLGARDAARLSLAQPMRLEAGTIELTEVQVIDRQTGEKGVVTQRFDLAGAQPGRLVMEGSYGAPLAGGRASVNLFARGELRDLDVGTPRVMIGSQLELAF